MTIKPIERPSLFDAVGGGEETHFNPVCVELIDRIVGPVLGVDVDDVQREVPCLGRRLDLFATAEARRVAIELQYGEADPSHLGRLLGWYAPHVAATDAILVAESFPASLVDAVRDQRIRGLALVRVLTGWNRDGAAALDFEVVMSNITPVQGGSLGGDQKSDDRRASNAILGDALSGHGLKDSNARDYVRLFPIVDGFWANAEIRASRVVLRIGAAPIFDAEAAARRLDPDWGPQGNGMSYTVSDDVESYRLSPESAEKVAEEIAGMTDEILEALVVCKSCVLDTNEDDEETGE